VILFARAQLPTELTRLIFKAGAKYFETAATEADLPTAHVCRIDVAGNELEAEATAKIRRGWVRQRPKHAL